MEALKWEGSRNPHNILPQQNYVAGRKVISFGSTSLLTLKGFFYRQY